MKFIISFLFSLTSCLIIFIGISYYLQPLSGDLTRIGKLAERDFGANQTQQSYWVRGIDDMSASKILVIGDSFSISNTWQSFFYDMTGIKSTTFGFGSDDCIAPRIEKMINKISTERPNIKVIVIESVERAFVDRFNGSTDDCKISLNFPIIDDRTISSGYLSLGKRSHSIWDINTDLVYVMTALLHHLKGESQNIWQKGSAMIAPLTSGEFFSNNASNFLLFYQGDISKSSWGEEDLKTVINKLKSINNLSNASNIKVYYLIVPDKSSIYRDGFKETPKFLKTEIDLRKIFEENYINHIDIKPRFLAESKKTKDFYLPNDTHLSLYGYKIMAEEVAAYLSKK